MRLSTRKENQDQERKQNSKRRKVSRDCRTESSDIDPCLDMELTKEENEIAWLVEESKGEPRMHNKSDKQKCVCWDFVQRYARSSLKALIQETKKDKKWANANSVLKVKMTVRQNMLSAFEKKRKNIRKALDQGYVRERMKSVMGNSTHFFSKVEEKVKKSKPRQDMICSPEYLSSRTSFRDYLLPSMNKPPKTGFLPIPPISLNPTEIEISWLLEESKFYFYARNTDEKLSSFSWKYIQENASQRLISDMRQVQLSKFLGNLVRIKMQQIFHDYCSNVREALYRGYRREGIEYFDFDRVLATGT